MSDLSLIFVILGALFGVVQLTTLIGIIRHKGEASLIPGYLAAGLFIAAVLTR